MSDYKPRIGDCVRLKSGGLKMTITGTDTDTQSVECLWHKSDGSLERNRFPLRALDIIEGQGALAP